MIAAVQLCNSAHVNIFLLRPVRSALQRIPSVDCFLVASMGHLRAALQAKCICMQDFVNSGDQSRLMLPESAFRVGAL